MADRLLAEYESEDAIVRAIGQLRDERYLRLEAYLPFPSHEVDEALGARHSRLPYVIFAFGMAGAGGAYLLQWFLVAYLYPLVVGSRPPHFPLAFVLITFEMGVLFASFCAFFGTLALGRLLRLVDGVQGTPGFESVTRDHFWLEVTLPVPDAESHTRRVLAGTGALRVEAAEAM